MALSSSTFTNLAGAASDLFSGVGAATAANLKAKGLNLDAEGYRIKARGDLAEAGNYDLAGDLAARNVGYTAQATEIKQQQQDREMFGAIGSQRAGFAASGLKQSGSALDILSSSAAQGQLAKSVLGAQGEISEESYVEQAKSFRTMADAGRMAAAGETDIAGKTDLLANETVLAGDQQQKGSFISAAIKGIAGIAGLALAPATGGLSLAVTGAAASAVGDPNGSGGLY